LATDLTFEQVVRDHQDMVFRTLLRLTGSREHLDDLAQDVFLRLYRALPSFRGDALITTYLYRIAVNVAQDEWKRRRHDRDTHARSPTTPPPGKTVFRIPIAMPSSNWRSASFSNRSKSNSSA